MTPAELNHWAATDVMGWVEIQVYAGGQLRRAWAESLDGEPLHEVQYYTPTRDHNQCQQVIEKAMERGVEPYMLNKALLADLDNLKDIQLRCWIATAEQKLRAVYEACKEKE